MSTTVAGLIVHWQALNHLHYWCAKLISTEEKFAHTGLNTFMGTNLELLLQELSEIIYIFLIYFVTLQSRKRRTKKLGN